MTKLCIFDYDGVIADTEGLHFETFHEALAPEGILIDRVESDRRFVGIDIRTSFRLAFDGAGRSLSARQLERLVERKGALFRARLEDVRLFEGAAEAVKEASARFPLAIASGAHRREIESVLEREGLLARFAALVSGDDGLPSKPSPEVYANALERVTRSSGEVILPAECLVVEDSVPGIRAARAAGMRAVALCHSHPAERLGEADLVLPDMRRLLERIRADDFR
jgi:beta-phosphoglucomutase-like phosphatase (HAD superfamily)